MAPTPRAVVAAALVLTALTGCGKSAVGAAPSHVYTPLPSLSTATPTASPSPSTSRKPAARPAPSPTSTGSVTTAPAGGGTAAAASAGDGAAAVPAQTPAAVEPQPPAPAGSPLGDAAPAAGSAPVRSTESTSTTTTTVTKRTLASRVVVVVLCQGPCALDDVDTSELTGADGPFSPESLTEALEAAPGEDTVLTGELAESLTRPGWDLDEQLLEGGQGKLVLTSTAR